MRPLPASAFSGAQIIPFMPRRAEAADPLALLSRLRRPARLLAAARLGVAGYDRARHLRRLLKAADLPGPRAALARLMAQEAEVDAARREGRADYDVARHLSLMIAALAEGRVLAAASPRTPLSAPPSASPSASLEQRPEDAPHHRLPGA